jgi:hypothetical protein
MMKDSPRNKALPYFIYYFLTLLPLAISVLGSIFLAFLVSDDNKISMSGAFLCVYLLWFLLLCLNFSLGANLGYFELHLLSFFPIFVYVYLYAFRYYIPPPPPSTSGGRYFQALALYGWFFFSRGFIFLEERRHSFWE